MKNLLDELREIGLTDEQAKKSVEVVYNWVDERYPVLGALARPMVRKEFQQDNAKEEQTF